MMIRTEGDDPARGPAWRRWILPSHGEMYRDDYMAPLKDYKYWGVDKSPISNLLLRPYWNWVTGLFPLWVAYGSWPAALSPLMLLRA